MSTRRADGTTTAWPGGDTSFEVEVLEIKQDKKYDPKGPFDQVVGTGKCRVALSLKGAGTDIFETWAAGTSAAEVVLSGGPP